MDGARSGGAAVDANGGFSLDANRGVRYRLIVESGGRIVASQEFVAGEGDLAVDLTGRQ